MATPVSGRFRSMRLVPGTISSTGARVVADCEPDPGHFQYTSFLQPQTGHGTAGKQPRSSLFSASIPTNEGANLFDHEPYVHVGTGERAVIPVCVHFAYGLRFEIVAARLGFAPAAVGELQRGFPADLFGRVSGRTTDPPIVPPSAPVSASPHYPYGAFLIPRRICFDDPSDHDGHDHGPSLASESIAFALLQSTTVAILVL